MLQNRNWIVVGIAVALGLAAVYLTNTYLAGVAEREAGTAQANQMVKIAVARAPLPYGAVLTPGNVDLADWPANSLPPGAFRTLQGLVDGKPRATLRPMEQGEPILPGKITGPGGRVSISEQIEPDMRAVAVRINDVAGVAGFILPGDRVDVLVTRTPVVMTAGAPGEPITDVLLQNIRVVGIDQNSDDKSDKPQLGKTVTLAVDPMSAQKLALAGQVGSLSLALRNGADPEPSEARTVGPDDLRDGAAGGYASRGWSYAGPAAAPSMMVPGRGFRSGAPVRKPNTVSVQIVRGVESSSYEVKRYGGF